MRTYILGALEELEAVMTIAAIVFGFLVGVFFSMALITPFTITRKAKQLLEHHLNTVNTEPLSYRIGYTRALNDMTEDRRKEDTPSH